MALVTRARRDAALAVEKLVDGGEDRRQLRQPLVLQQRAEKARRELTETELRGDLAQGRALDVARNGGIGHHLAQRRQLLHGTGEGADLLAHGRRLFDRAGGLEEGVRVGTREALDHDSFSRSLARFTSNRRLRSSAPSSEATCLVATSAARRAVSRARLAFAWAVRERISKRACSSRRSLSLLGLREDLLALLLAFDLVALHHVPELGLQLFELPGQ